MDIPPRREHFGVWRFVDLVWSLESQGLGFGGLARRIVGRGSY